LGVDAVKDGGVSWILEEAAIDECANPVRDQLSFGLIVFGATRCAGGPDEASPSSMRAITAQHVLRDHVIRPILARRPDKPARFATEHLIDPRSTLATPTPRPAATLSRARHRCMNNAVVDLSA
jgi:hypothetical protein